MRDTYTILGVQHVHRTLDAFGIDKPFVRRAEEQQMAYKKIESDVSEWWKPTVENDQREGVVDQIRESEEYGTSLLLKNEKGELVGLPSHSALQNLTRNVKVGDKVKVVFLGKKMGNKGREFLDYEVYRDE